MQCPAWSAPLTRQVAVLQSDRKLHLHAACLPAGTPSAGVDVHREMAPGLASCENLRRHYAPKLKLLPGPVVAAPFFFACLDIPLTSEANWGLFPIQQGR